MTAIVDVDVLVFLGGFAGGMTFIVLVAVGLELAHTLKRRREP